MNEDYDLIQDEREHQYRHRLQQRMALLHERQEMGIIEAEQERLRIMGVVDISEGESK